MAETMAHHSPCWGCGNQSGPCQEGCDEQTWPAQEIQDRPEEEQ